MIEKKKETDVKEKLKESYERVKARVKEHPVMTGVTVFLLIYVSGIISQAIYSLLHIGEILNGAIERSKAFSFGPRALIQWCTSIRGFLCLIVVSVGSYFVWKYLIKSRIKEKTGIDDDRNFEYSKKSPYGTARPLTEEDLKDILEFKSIEETNGIILGETYDGKVVSIPTSEELKEKARRNHWSRDDMTNNTRNKNILVVGSPGTMKSRAFIMNQILQAMKAGESIMVTDPKGELYEKTYSILSKNGYDVKMFNLIKQENSDGWNPVEELNKDTTYAKIFSQTVVENADENGEEYWKNNSMNFMKAALQLDSTGSMGKLYDFISGNTLESFQNIFTTAEQPVAKRAYQIFEQCTETVKGQIINGLGIMIDLFQDDKIRNITSVSDIDMTKPAREKCAYFVITSDQHRTFDYLAVLFWTMAFIKLIEYIDENRDENGDPTTLPVHMLLDEFPNVGEIPDFNRKLSTVRSRLLYVTIVIQNLPQLMNRYPNGMHEEIFSDCDFVVFLGCNDKTTAEYFSELTGIASIEVTTENNVYHREQAILNQESEYREVKSIGQRTVMNMDEIKSIKNTDLLVFIRGTKSVFQIKKFDYSKNPLSKDIEIYKIKDHVPKWRQSILDAEEQKRKEAEKREAEREAIKKKKKANIIPDTQIKTKQTSVSNTTHQSNNITNSKNKELESQRNLADYFESLRGEINPEVISKKVSNNANIMQISDDDLITDETIGQDESINEKDVEKINQMATAFVNENRKLTNEKNKTIMSFNSLEESQEDFRAMLEKEEQNI